MRTPITISYKWTPEECRRFELAQKLASELLQNMTKPGLSFQLASNSRQGAATPRTSFRKRLVVSMIMCVVVASALAVSAGLPWMNPAQAYSVAIGFVAMFTVPFGWAVFRKRTSVTFMSVLAGVGCACVGPTVTGYVPLASAWPYYLGMGLVVLGIVLVARGALWGWQQWMSLRLRQQLCKSPEVRWEVDADGPNVRFGGGDRTTWDNIERIVRTNDGFLLWVQAKQIHNNTIERCQKLFLWFPVHAFKTTDEVERFASLVQAKARRYEIVGPLRQVTTP